MESGNTELLKFINDAVNNNLVVIFSKTTCPYCYKAKNLLKAHGVPYSEVILDKMENGLPLKAELMNKTGQRTVPQIFINKQFIGGFTDLEQQLASGSLTVTLSSFVKTFTLKPKKPHNYEYDLIVIGGGSGGLACSKEAALFGQKVALFDFVRPTPIGTTWGLGGTCVNVGCIPKKLMHTASLLGEAVEDAKSYGWNVTGSGHNWEKMRDGIQEHIRTTNENYRTSLRDKHVEYFNAYARFLDPHRIEGTDGEGKKFQITGDKILIATGLRPKYPSIPGAREFGITSDDLFSLKYNPGKILIVGGSYVALECGGFLKGIGLDVTIMVRSILLRGYDQDMAERIGKHMQSIGIKFIRPAVPIKVEQITEGNPGKLGVVGLYGDGPFKGQEIGDKYNTVIFAIGREPIYGDECNFQAAGVKVNLENMKISVNQFEQTNVPHIYAVGDILDGRPEFTPVAIQAGRLLARRLFHGETEQMDYENIPTTVFTPLEYGTCGLSEEEAIRRHGKKNIEVYHSHFKPFEWILPHRGSSNPSAGNNEPSSPCYLKLVCLKTKKDRVLGVHFLGPNAGEVAQGFAVAIQCRATKKDFDKTVGIHPTNSEMFTVLDVTKTSGADINNLSCCG